jgi:fibronectin-binding autotransporter adhesin
MTTQTFHARASSGKRRLRERRLLVPALAAGFLARAAGAALWLPQSGTNEWTADANWDPPPAPNASGAVAEFSGDSTADQTVNLTTNVTAGRIVLGDSDGSHALRIAPNGGALTLDIAAGSASIVQTATSKGDEIAAPIALNANAVISNAAADATLTLSGPIGGSKALTLVSGTAAFRGTEANTYSGNTVINGGTLLLGKPAGVDALYGNIVIDGGTLKLEADNQIPGGSPSRGVIALNGGCLDLNGHAEGLRALTGAGGLITSSAEGTATLSLTENQASAFSGVIADGGPGKVVAVKGGQAALTLAGTNTYSGGTATGTGALILGSDYALGSGSLPCLECTVKSDGPAARTLTNSVIQSKKVTYGAAGTGDLAFGPLVINGNYGIVVNNNRTTFASLDSRFIITKSGAGAAVFAGDVVIANNDLKIVSGMLAIQGEERIGKAIIYDDIAGGVLGRKGAFARTLGGGSGQIKWNAGKSGGFAAFGGDLAVTLSDGADLAWASTTCFVGDGGALVFSHQEADATVDFQNAVDLNGAGRTIRVDDGSAAVDAVLSGALTGGAAGSGLLKTGAGTLSLAHAANSCAGDTIVSNGTLRVDGGLTTATVTVAADGTLGGTGTVAAANGVLVAGTLAADDPGGALTVDGDVVLDGTLAVTANDAACGRIVLNGPLALGETARLSLAGLDAYKGWPSLILVANDGREAVSGTFAGLPEGAVALVAGGRNWRIGYGGGDGNDVVLTASAGTLILLR